MSNYTQINTNMTDSVDPAVQMLLEAESNIDTSVMHHSVKDDAQRASGRRGSTSRGVRKGGVKKGWDRNQEVFYRTMVAVRSIVRNKLYKRRTSSLETYFRKRWRVSRAQVYRFMDCARVLQELDGFPQLPCRERFCRALKSLARNPDEIRQLWEAVLEQVNAESGDLTSSLIQRVHERLVADPAAPYGDSSATVLSLRNSPEPISPIENAPSELQLKLEEEDEGGMDTWDGSFPTYLKEESDSAVVLTPDELLSDPLAAAMADLSPPYASSPPELKTANDQPQRRYTFPLSAPLTINTMISSPTEAPASFYDVTSITPIGPTSPGYGFPTSSPISPSFTTYPPPLSYHTMPYLTSFPSSPTTQDTRLQQQQQQQQQQHQPPQQQQPLPITMMPQSAPQLTYPKPPRHRTTSYRAPLPTLRCPPPKFGQYAIAPPPVEIRYGLPSPTEDLADSTTMYAAAAAAPVLSAAGVVAPIAPAAGTAGEMGQSQRAAVRLEPLMDTGGGWDYNRL
ncbi:hypothetical protein HDV00_006130 [Rhizophlyctis rosea]|nr:hypothetical protein HDV00_006130 [Rhizophlyctis rosea]